MTHRLRYGEIAETDSGMQIVSEDDHSVEIWHREQLVLLHFDLATDTIHVYAEPRSITAVPTMRRANPQQGYIELEVVGEAK